MREGDLIAGRYRLLRRIGAGAMGTVWAARHELLDRDLALKVCTLGEQGKRASADKRELFLREVRIVGRLRHPNVVDIADAGDAGIDGLYLAMELLDGQSLAQRISQGPLPASEALAIAAEVCRGLVAAHDAGVIHRDLKPENIFLARGPSGGVVPKLLDFGVSSARDVASLRQSEAFGTPAYMSPEQALGEGGVDHRTDVWAMGVVLHEMLTGRLPFQAASYLALLPLIIDAPAPPLPASVPVEARTVIAGCLAKSPDDRYPTAGALLAAIDRALEGVPARAPASSRSAFFIETGAPAVPPSTRGRTSDHDGGPPSAPSMRRARRGLALAILAVPLAIGVAAVATRGRGAQAPRAAAALTPTPTPTPITAQEPALPVPATSAQLAAAPLTATPAPSAPAGADGGAPPVRRTSPRGATGEPLGVPPRSTGPQSGARKVTNVDKSGF